MAAVAFAIYAIAAARDVMFGDGLELTGTAVANGIAHAPGYPLWIMLGHLAALIPAGPVPYRVNLTAALYHSIALGIVYATARELTHRRLAALAAVAVLGLLSPLFVVWSLQAEVFSLNDLFAASIVYLSLRWTREPRRRRYFYALAALFGLGSSNQQTLLLLVPFSAWCAWQTRADWPHGGRAARTSAIGVCLFFIAFALPYVHVGNPQMILALVTRREYGGLALVGNPAQQGGDAFARILWLVAAGGTPYVAILAGIAIAARRSRINSIGPVLIATFCIVVFALVASLALTRDDARGVFARFGLLPLVSLAPWAAMAFTNRAIASGALVTCAIAGTYALTQLSLASTHDARTFANDVFAAIPAKATLLAAGEAAETTLAYFHDSEGMRPDVTLIRYGHLPGYAALPPQLLRDTTINQSGNTSSFYVVGDQPIHLPSQAFIPLRTGLVSHMIPATSRFDLSHELVIAVTLERARGYGDITSSFWKSNGFAQTVRQYYAAGYYLTGVYAEAQRAAGAHEWYERALQYAYDPAISAAALRTANR